MKTLAPLLAALAALALVACPPVRGDDDDSGPECANPSQSGTLHACVYWDEGGEAIASGRVSVRSGPEEDPIDALTGADGCVEMQLTPGDWEASGSNQFGDCVTPYEPIEVVGCETLEVEFYVGEWCMDGR